MVGEPQNIIVGGVAGWNFGEFALRVAPVSVPVVICGFSTCIILEKTHWFGFVTAMPESV